MVNFKLLHDFQHLVQHTKGQLGSTIRRQCQRRPDSILNLPTINPFSAELLPLGFTKFLLFDPGFVEEGSPDLNFGSGTKFPVPQGHVDS